MKDKFFQIESAERLNDMGYDLNKEIQEAINAGENALRSLREAQRYLNSAGNWGLVDIFGVDF